MKIKPSDILKGVFALLLVLFISLYVSQATGYYAYSNYEKTVLTEEGIQQFEQDVASGKNIDVNDYIKNTDTYNNKISDTGLKISNTVSKYIKRGIVSVFKKINKLIE